MTRVLIVEDDRSLRIGLEDMFRDEGFDVTAVDDGDAAHELLFSRHFDVIVLDWMLPGRSRLELLKALREARVETPVLLLTARGDESDKVLGLELGADDYLTKPFGARELLARVRVMLRRTGHTASKGDAQVFQVGEARVDLGSYEVERSGRVHRLSPKEAGMLALLFRERDQVVRRERFLDEVWGTENFVGNRTVDTHMLNLRQKLEPDPKAPKFLLTVHGVGYRLTLGAEA